jgi:hypothetical protein
VLGPAAYFADLLMFLRDRNSTKPNKPGGGYESVKKILFDRRPDLGYLELNCENGLTNLPYVDVDCEVLERVVAAGENDVELTGLGVMPGDAAAAKALVATHLPAKHIEVGSDFTLSQVDPADPDRWVVHGDTATYLLKKKGTPNFFAELLPNTKAGADELRAYPSYVNPKAYEKLRQARHPLAIPLDLFPEGDSRRLEQRARRLSLPFDLFAEEVRAAFKKCGVQRWDLMRTLQGPAAPNNPTCGDIAAEYFGIGPDEKWLIADEMRDAAGQWDERALQEVWGETGNAGWLNTPPTVKTFLRKTGLEYDELLALIDLRFINPARDIVVQHLDSSCDTENKVIQGLGPANLDRLDRIHRFLRLWRRLTAWKMCGNSISPSAAGESEEE